MIKEKMEEDQVKRLTHLLQMFGDIFVFSHEEMPGIYPKLAMHSLNVRPKCKPIKQRKRRMNDEKTTMSIVETAKLLQVGFIKEVQYPEWISNPVMVNKKNGE